MAFFSWRQYIIKESAAGHVPIPLQPAYKPRPPPWNNRSGCDLFDGKRMAPARRAGFYTRPALATDSHQDLVPLSLCSSTDCVKSNNRGTGRTTSATWRHRRIIQRPSSGCSSWLNRLSSQKTAWVFDTSLPESGPITFMKKALNDWDLEHNWLGTSLKLSLLKYFQNHVSGWLRNFSVHIWQVTAADNERVFYRTWPAINAKYISSAAASVQKCNKTNLM